MNAHAWLFKGAGELVELPYYDHDPPLPPGRSRRAIPQGARTVWRPRPARMGERRSDAAVCRARAARAGRGALSARTARPPGPGVRPGRGRNGRDGRGLDALIA